MDSNIKRDIILDHCENPRNRGLIDDDIYIKTNVDNESCIDEIDLMVKIENDVIKDIKFDGEACSICISSASIMTETLIDKTLKEAIDIYQNFDNMINEKEYDQSILEQAIVYDEIYKQANRKKCALLPWWGIKKIIDRR